VKEHIAKCLWQLKSQLKRKLRWK